MTRDRTTVALKLSEARRKLAATRKLAETTTKAQTAEICDRLTPSLERKIAELEAELAAAPERKAVDRFGGFVLPEGAMLCTGFEYRKTLPTPAEIEEFGQLEIPAFLRRRSA